jgi:hypothetical protein
LKNAKKIKEEARSILKSKQELGLVETQKTLRVQILVSVMQQNKTSLLNNKFRVNKILKANLNKKLTTLRVSAKKMLISFSVLKRLS